MFSGNGCGIHAYELYLWRKGNIFFHTCKLSDVLACSAVMWQDAPEIRVGMQMRSYGSAAFQPQLPYTPGNKRDLLSGF